MNESFDLQIVTVLENIDEETDKRVRAAKKIAKDKDLLYAKFRYVHEGSNGNRDGFYADELKERHTTAIFKPLNWEHKDYKIIGSIYDTEYIDAEDNENGKAGVNVYGVIYKWLFKDKAQEIVSRFSKGDLKISMETWYEYVTCSECGKDFTDASDYCEHLTERFSRANVTRYLRDITFGGAGIVEKPADKDATALSVAEELSIGKELKDRVSKREEVQRFNTIINEAGGLFYDIIWKYYSNETDGIKDRKNRLKELITDLKNLLDSININKISKGESIVEDKVFTYPQEVVDVLIEKAKADKADEFQSQLNTELDKVKASLQSQIDSLTEQLSTAQEELNTAKAEKDTVTKEFDDFKAAIAKEKKETERKDALVKANIEISEQESEIVMAMDDKTFNFFVEKNKSVANENTEEETEEEEEEEEETQNASASLNVNDSDNAQSKNGIETILAKIRK